MQLKKRQDLHLAPRYTHLPYLDEHTTTLTQRAAFHFCFFVFFGSTIVPANSEEAWCVPSEKLCLLPFHFSLPHHTNVAYSSNPVDWRDIAKNASSAKCKKNILRKKKKIPPKKINNNFNLQKNEGICKLWGNRRLILIKRLGGVYLKSMWSVTLQEVVYECRYFFVFLVIKKGKDTVVPPSVNLTHLKKRSLSHSQRWHTILGNILVAKNKKFSEQFGMIKCLLWRWRTLCIPPEAWQKCKPFKR